MSAIASLTLSELNSIVREALSLTLPDEYWVTVEIHELHTAMSGHAYAELVEKDTRSEKIVAKARANIWANVYKPMSERFERITGKPLRSGIKVLVRVAVSFHEIYGFAYTITDVDPTYTLGDLARRRMEILRQLDEEGVRDDNKSLPLPHLVQRVAVISSPTTAGYGDFMKHLDEHRGILQIETKLFEAVMQGDKVESTIIKALVEIESKRDEWDAVIILRGGGATSDFQGFETYLLAAAVAQFPLPIITAIGHERDNTVLDEVSNTRLKTPTAAAAFIVNRMQAEADAFEKQKDRLHTSVEDLLKEARMVLHNDTLRTYRVFADFASDRRRVMTRMVERLRAAGLLSCRDELHDVARSASALRSACDSIIMRCKHRHEVAQQAVKAYSPERILNMGYSYSTIEGRVVRSSEGLAVGDGITTHFASGSVDSVITKTYK